MQEGKKANEMTSEEHADVDQEWQVVKQFLRLKPPEYFGSADPSVTWNWLTEIEEKFDACGCDDLHKVKLGVRMLRGWGFEWWATFSDSIGYTKASCLDWADFKNRMIKDFRLDKYKSELEREFLSLKMEIRMSVEEYGQEFMKKMRLVKHLVSNENYKIDRFVKGLPKEFEGKVGPNILQGAPTTLTEAIFRAISAEEGINLVSAFKSVIKE